MSVSMKREVTTSEEKVPFNRKQVKLAVAALLAHLEDKASEKKKKDELFESEGILWLLLGLKKVPQDEKKARRIPIPHSYNTSPTEICLITKEPGKIVKQKLQELGITSITKVISLTKLRKEFKTFTLKRQLLATYDVFLCDDRIYHFVTKTLGKEFYKKKKEPIPICLTYSDWKSEISKSLCCTLLRLGHGPCSAVKVGSITHQSEKQLSENAIHMMKVIGRHVPGNWKNIKCFHLKTSTSVALPLYQSSPLIDGSLEKKLDEKAKKSKFNANVGNEEIAISSVKEENTVSALDVAESTEVNATIPQDGEDEEANQANKNNTKRKGKSKSTKTTLGKKKKKTLKSI